MSIFFDFDLGPSGRRFRRAVDSDKHEIKCFLERDETTSRLFGRSHIGSLIELSTLAICMVSNDHSVVGFAAFCDHPDVPGIDPGAWEHWIRNMYQRYYLSRNTLFIHLMCCADTVKECFLEEALMSVFCNDSYLQHIVLVAPPHFPEQDLLVYLSRRRNIYQFSPKQGDVTTVGQTLYVFTRHEFCPKLKIRRAVEEDNDEIVAILDKSCPRLKDLYGEYYISELIGRHPESTRKIIVAEDYQHPVGVMCLNSQINYENLNATYELSPYHCLHKTSALEKEKCKRANRLLTAFGEPIMNGKWSPFKKMPKLDTIQLTMEERISKDIKARNRSMKLSKVSFGWNAAMRKSFDLIMHRAERHTDDLSDKQESRLLSTATNYTVVDLLDEDPFDYDIVNIEHKLLSVPNTLSFEYLNARGTNLKIGSHKDAEAGRRRRISSISSRGRASILMPNKQEETESVTYQGEPDAFSIDLLGFQEGFHDRHAFELLGAAFELMKGYNYCIIRVPCSDKTFPLLTHFSFVPTKSKVCSEYALYVAHRASIIGKMRVRKAELADVPQIALLLQDTEAKDTLWSIQSSIMRKEHYIPYVFISGTTIVGVAVTEQSEKMDFIRAEFNLEMYHIHKYHRRGLGISEGVSTLKVAIMYPAFENHYRFFLREIMRLEGTSSVLWLTSYRNKWYAHKANSLVSAMIPLMPRKSKVDCTFVPELKNVTDLENKISAFSCWLMGKKLTSLQKVDVNTRLVIVGASRTAMAFLNALLFSDTASYLNFTSVTLVSAHGLPYSKRADIYARTMFPRDRTQSDRFLMSVSYTYYVNVVHGTMVQIDKKNKFIRLSNGSKQHYDLLFLLLGRQYQHPNYLKNACETEMDLQNGEARPYVRLDIPRQVESELDIATESLPENVFIVNDINDACASLKYVRSLYWQDFSRKIIVYGATIEAYCCLSALLEMKVPVEKIVFVEPFPPEDESKVRVSVFSNENVDDTVMEVLNNLNLTVYRSYYFISWDLDECNSATHVNFLSHFHMITLECAGLFYYGKRGINLPALNAINKSSIGYDGGILIDHQFRTKEPSVYAAGRATRYYRRYFADSYRQKYYNSYEVGETLGIQIRNQLDPLLNLNPPRPMTHQPSVRFSVPFGVDSSSGTADQSEQSSTSTTSSAIDAEENKLPTLKKPITVCCTLPGGLQYLEVRSPGLKTPHHYLESLHYTGHVMETFIGGYFKIHLTNDHVVDRITCLSSETHSLENFENLYGLHATVLNNCHLRFAAKKLNSFFNFFRSQWAFFLYHEHCNELFAMTKELRPKGQRKGETIKEALLKIGDDLEKPSYSDHTKQQIRSKFEQSAHVSVITEYVLEWLSENEVLLPVYMHPYRLAQFTQTHHHPAFAKKKTHVDKLFKQAF